MADIFDYLIWRGDLSLEAVPLNPVDTLILSELSYLGLEGLVPGDFRTTLRSCARVPRETIRNEKWTTKLAGFVLKTIAPLL